ncbi:MAG TPA: DNA polymerase III subunit epsilon [Burkholderiales bacterium]
MNRQIVLDTETTGLEPAQGHRIVEIGCVEMMNRRLTGNNFHRYLNPGRESDEAALEVHGLTTEFLADKPRFAEVADELMAFVGGAEIIIHNAPFDLAFLNAELARMKRPAFTKHVGGVVDSLLMAKELYPGKRNNLDALCERYEISNAHRTLHGALLDGQLLAEVYLAMTRGQDALGMDLDGDDGGLSEAMAGIPLATFVVTASADEEAEHAKVLAAVAKECKGTPLWQA